MSEAAPIRDIMDVACAREARRHASDRLHLRVQAGLAVLVGEGVATRGKGEPIRLPALRQGARRALGDLFECIRLDSDLRFPWLEPPR